MMWSVGRSGSYVERCKPFSNNSSRAADKGGGTAPLAPPRPPEWLAARCVDLRQLLPAIPTNSHSSMSHGQEVHFSQDSVSPPTSWNFFFAVTILRVDKNRHIAAYKTAPSSWTYYVEKNFIWARLVCRQSVRRVWKVFGRGVLAPPTRPWDFLLTSLSRGHKPGYWDRSAIPDATWHSDSRGGTDWTCVVVMRRLQWSATISGSVWCVLKSGFVATSSFKR